MNKLYALSTALLISTAAHTAVVQDKTLSVLPENKETVSLIDQVDMVQQSFKSASSKNLSKTVKQFEYDMATTYKIPLRVGTTTTFVFDEPILSHVQGASNELFETRVFLNSSADPEKGEKFILENMQYIQAKSPNKDMSIQFIAKSGRIYNFYVYSLDRESKELPVLTAYVKLNKMEKAMVDMREALDDQKSEKTLREKARLINLQGENNAFTAYMKELFPRGVNVSYDMYGNENSEMIAPAAIFDNGKRTFFNLDGILPSDEIGAVFKVVDGIEVPQQKKDAFTIDKAFKGWIYVDTISQEGFVMRVGDKYICIKPSVELKDFHKIYEPKPSKKLSWGGEHEAS